MFSRDQHRDVDARWEAFEAEALPYLDDMFRFAMWLVRDRHEAEDLVQETFVQALGSFHRFEKGTNCRAWLITIMYHMRSKWRRSASRLRLVDDVDEQIAETVAFEPPSPEGVTEEEVLLALERLPRSYQEVVLLSDVQEMTYKEIAKLLSIPVGTVMSRLHRGRKILRAELAEYANRMGIGHSADNGSRAAEVSG
ncbi:MAG: sigma-70 family RNA polymerase sigma factor [Blastocatellia bacterium]